MHNLVRRNILWMLLISSFLVWKSSLASEQPSSLIHQLETLVQINSQTDRLSGVLEVQHWIEAQLKPLGFQTELGEDHLLIANLEGRKSKTVTLLIHADTLLGQNSRSQGLQISPDRKKAFGSGVADNKGGIVIAIEGIRRYLKTNAPKFNIRVVSSPSEEKRLPQLLTRFSALATDSWLVLSFEPAPSSGTLIQSRRGSRWYSITADGKEAHAGKAHKEGVNACNALAIALSEISRFTRYDRDVTVSIGHMEGGEDKFNVVCGEAQAKVDTRFASLVERDQLHRRMSKILAHSPVKGAKLSFKLVDDTPAFSATKSALPYLKQYQSSLQQLEGKSTTLEKSGIITDANFFSHDTAIILDGLGPVGEKIHTEQESVELSSLESRSEALHRFLVGLK